MSENFYPVHFVHKHLSDDGTWYVLACGTESNLAMRSRDASRVGCKRCKRTKAYKEAVRKP